MTGPPDSAGAGAPDAPRLGLDPPQPTAVARALEQLIGRTGRAADPDPWWQAGLDEALESAGESAE